MKGIIFGFLFSISSFIALSEEHVKLYVNIIQCSGEQSATELMVDSMLCKLSTGFDGITSFSWDGTIAYRSGPGVCDNKTIFTIEIAQYNQADGINIYILGNHVSGGLGNTNDGVIRIGSGIRNDASPHSPVLETHVITHEMGHVFGLAHTSDDSNECDDPKNFMCEDTNSGTCGSGCGPITDWEEFSYTQKQIMLSYLNGRPNLFTNEIGQDLCEEPEPPGCEAPDANKISFTTTYFGSGNWWITSAHYNGSISGPEWEWDVELGTMWGQTNSTVSWIWWKETGNGIDFRIRVKNDCGSISNWKNASIRTN